MSFQAYLDSIVKVTGRIPQELVDEAHARGYGPATKAGEIVTWLADDRSGSIFVSPNAAQVTGFTAEELTARGKDGWFDRIHPDDVETVRRNYEALEFKREPFDIEYRMRHRNGAWIWIHDCAVST